MFDSCVHDEYGKRLNVESWANIDAASLVNSFGSAPVCYPLEVFLVLINKITFIVKTLSANVVFGFSSYCWLY